MILAAGRGKSGYLKDVPRVFQHMLCAVINTLSCMGFGNCLGVCTIYSLTRWFRLHFQYERGRRVKAMVLAAGRGKSGYLKEAPRVFQHMLVCCDQYAELHGFRKLLGCFYDLFTDTVVLK